MDSKEGFAFIKYALQMSCSWLIVGTFSFCAHNFGFLSPPLLYLALWYKGECLCEPSFFIF